jgi:hypothetical protein
MKLGVVSHKIYDDLASAVSSAADRAERNAVQAQQLSIYKVGLKLAWPDHVRVQGLTSRPEFNGQFGKVAKRMDPYQRQAALRFLSSSVRGTFWPSSRRI